MNYVLFGLTLTILATSGCGGSKSNTQVSSATPPVGEAQMDTDILGLWDLNPLAGEGDNAYMEIRDDRITYFYYQGNQGAASRNCYIVDAVALTKLGGSSYLLRGYQNEITVVDNAVTFTFVDVADDDGDGDKSETLVEQFPRVENVSVVDLIPCA